MKLKLLPKPESIIFSGSFLKCPELPLTSIGVESNFTHSINQSLSQLPALDSYPIAGQIHEDFDWRIHLGSHSLGSSDLFFEEQINVKHPIWVKYFINKSFEFRTQSNLSEKVFNAGTFNEAFRITVENEKKGASPITIEASSQIGLLHGAFTLVQLFRQFGRLIPTCIIEDAPAFQKRGLMLDISRDRVPTMPELFSLVDMLASLKMNHLQLYTEHTFAYAGHEVVWEHASPMTPEEVEELDRYCQQRNITLAANQNCFGHLHNWLKHPEYRKLAEVTKSWDFNGFPRSGPFSLCPVDPGSIIFIEDLLGKLLPNFSSNLVNIGCDETFDIGQGRSKQAVQEKGKFVVYWDFVKKVMNVARENGKRPMFWADMWLDLKNSGRAEIPADVISLIWGYEPESDFSQMCRLIQSEEHETWVCPGSSSWRSITGRTFERRENCQNAALQGYRHKAAGFLLTDWGDLGHRQQFPISLNAIAEGAQYAWSGDKTENVEEATSLQVFGDWNLHVAAWLNELGNIDLDLRRPTDTDKPEQSKKPFRNASCIFLDLEENITDEPRISGESNWQAVLDKLHNLRESKPVGFNTQIEEEITHTLNVAQYAIDRALLRRKSNGINDVSKKILNARMEDIIVEFQKLWRKRSRPGGLSDSCKYYQARIDELIDYK